MIISILQGSWGIVVCQKSKGYQEFGDCLQRQMIPTLATKTSLQQWKSGHRHRKKSSTKHILPDKPVDAWLQVEMNPGMVVATYWVAGQGITPLTILPYYLVELESNKIQGAYEKATETNRTIRESKQLSSVKPQWLAIGFDRLHCNISTFCALMWILFGDKFDYYNKFLQILTIMEKYHVEVNKHNFTPNNHHSRFKTIFQQPSLP